MTDATRASETTARQGKPWLLVAILSLIYTCAFIDRTVLALLVEPIRKDLGLTDTQMSMLVGLAFGLSYAMFNVPAGYLVDRVGRRGLIATATIGWSLMTLICGLAQSFTQLFIARIGVGVAEAFVPPACFSLIRDRVSTEQRGRAFSLFGIAPYLGSAVAFIGGGAILAMAASGTFAHVPLLGDLRAWQVVLVLFAAIGPLLLLPLLLIAPDPVRHGGPAASGTTMREALVHVRLNRVAYAQLTGYVTCGSMLIFGAAAWVPTMMIRKYGLPISQAGYMTGTVTLIGATLGLLLCGMVLDRMTAARRDIRHYGAFAAGVTCIAAGLMPLVTAPGLAWLLYGVALFFAGTSYSVGATTLAQMTPAAIMGKTSALYLMIQSVAGGAAAPTVVALLSDNVFAGPLALSHALSTYCAITGLGGVVLALGLAKSLTSHEGGTL